jgi:hypothetical protein
MREGLDMSGQGFQHFHKECSVADYQDLLFQLDCISTALPIHDVQARKKKSDMTLPNSRSIRTVDR